MGRETKRIPSLALAFSLLVFASLAPSTSAAVSGPFDITNSSGGGVILSATSIDFALPTGGGIGLITTGIGTNLTYTAGLMFAGNDGLITDLSAGGPSPVVNFMTFTGQPGLHFDLTGLGPGAASTVATNSFDPNAPPASPFAGSPLILQSTGTGTTITFTAFGLAGDAGGLNSNWFGLFTLQIAGETPFQVQQTLLNHGTVSSTYSAAFQSVPEPGIFSLLLTGVVCGWTAIRKSRRQDS